MTYTQALAFLYEQLPAFQRDGKKAIKPGLDNIVRLCAINGHPEKSLRCIHVAGTNGKGSTSHIVAAMLQEAGFRVGLYTSPHLKDFRERIKINGIFVSPDWVVTFVNQYKQVVEQIQPSFFEWTVWMAFSYFRELGVDFAVIEVGLGGRLDSTNIIRPLVSVITNIGFDHMDILGDTLPKIAREKAGIIKSGVPVVIGDSNKEIAPVFLQKIVEESTSMWQVSEQYEWENWVILNPPIRAEGVLRNRISGETWDLDTDLSGSYQSENILTAWLTLDVLVKEGHCKVGSEIRINALKRVKNSTNFQGRWQCLGENPLVIVDTGHNAHAFEKHVEVFKTWADGHYVLGFVADKDVRSILSLMPRSGRYYFCQIHSPRAMSLIEIAALADEFELNYSLYEDVNSCLGILRDTVAPSGFIFVGGSTFLVAELNQIT